MTICRCNTCEGLDEAPFRICDECEENQEWCECEYRDQCCNEGEHCGHDHLVTDYYCCYCGEEFER